MIRKLDEKGRINNILVILKIFPQIWSLACLLEVYTRIVHGAKALVQVADVHGVGQDSVLESEIDEYRNDEYISDGYSSCEDDEDINDFIQVPKCMLGQPLKDYKTGQDNVSNEFPVSFNTMFTI